MQKRRMPKAQQMMNKQKQAEWIEDKKEKDRRNASLYNAVNREKIKARLAKCYDVNKEKRKEYNAKYYLTKRKPQRLKQKAQNRIKQEKKS
jgi:hypothetical protein